MNYVTDAFNYCFDSYRSPIPSNEEMLAKNLIEINNQKISRFLKKMDVEEVKILSTDVEKKIEDLRKGHLHAKTTATMYAFGVQTLGMIFISYKGKTLVATTAVSLLCGGGAYLWLNRITNQEEVGRQWGFIRIIRLKDKIASIEAEIDRIHKKNNPNLDTTQLVLAKNGYNRIIDRCVRIFLNSDEKQYFPIPGIGYIENWCYPDGSNTRKRTIISTKTVLMPVNGGYAYKNVPIGKTTTEFTTPGTELDKKVYEQLIKSGHKIK